MLAKIDEQSITVLLRQSLTDVEIRNRLEYPQCAKEARKLSMSLVEQTGNPALKRLLSEVSESGDKETAHPEALPGYRAAVNGLLG